MTVNRNQIESIQKKIEKGDLEGALADLLQVCPQEMQENVSELQQRLSKINKVEETRLIHALNDLLNDLEDFAPDGFVPRDRPPIVIIK